MGRRAERERADGVTEFDSVQPMTLLRRLAGPFFVFAGVMHFVRPCYRWIMPPYVPAPERWSTPAVWPRSPAARA